MGQDVGDGLDISAPTRFGSWQIVAASVAGSNHQGERNDDFYAMRQVGSILVVAVADGASSAVRGGEGARLAVEAAIRTVANRIEQQQAPDVDSWNALLADSIHTARNALGNVSTSFEGQGVSAADSLPPADGSGIKSYACTLMVAIIPDRGALRFIHIGDGGAIVQLNDGNLHSLSRGFHGEEEGMTLFLTSDRWLSEAFQASIEIDDVSGLMLFTDGIQDVAQGLPGWDPSPTFCRSMLRSARNPDLGAPALEAYLDSNEDIERFCGGDDKTVILLVRGDDPVQPPATARDSDQKGTDQAKAHQEASFCLVLVDATVLDSNAAPKVRAWMEEFLSSAGHDGDVGHLHLSVATYGHSASKLELQPAASMRFPDIDANAYIPFEQAVHNATELALRHEFFDSTSSRNGPIWLIVVTAIGDMAMRRKVSQAFQDQTIDCRPVLLTTEEEQPVVPLHVSRACPTFSIDDGTYVTLKSLLE